MSSRRLEAGPIQPFVSRMRTSLGVGMGPGRRRRPQPPAGALGCRRGSGLHLAFSDQVEQLDDDRRPDAHRCPASSPACRRARAPLVATPSKPTPGEKARQKTSTTAPVSSTRALSQTVPESRARGREADRRGRVCVTGTGGVRPGSFTSTIAPRCTGDGVGGGSAAAAGTGAVVTAASVETGRSVGNGTSVGAGAAQAPARAWGSGPGRGRCEDLVRALLHELRGRSPGGPLRRADRRGSRRTSSREAPGHAPASAGPRRLPAPSAASARQGPPGSPWRRAKGRVVTRGETEACPGRATPQTRPTGRQADRR